MRHLTAEEVLGINAEVLGGNIAALAERVAALVIPMILPTLGGF